LSKRPVGSLRYIDNNRKCQLTIKWKAVGLQILTRSSLSIRHLAQLQRQSWTREQREVFDNETTLAAMRETHEYEAEDARNPASAEAIDMATQQIEKFSTCDGGGVYSVFNAPTKEERRK
jgi:hypothetical protein